jgi:hypothetical protein
MLKYLIHRKSGILLASATILLLVYGCRKPEVIAVADFAFDGQTDSSPATLVFKNNSIGEKYLWEFGDGTVSTENNPEHVFYKNGTYKIKLTAWGTSNVDSVIEYISIGSGYYPIKDLSYIGMVPAAQEKNVLLMQATGVRWINGPGAAAQLEGFKMSKGGRLSLITAYIRSMPLLTMPWPGFEDLTSSVADEMIASTGTPANSFPAVYIDHEISTNWEENSNERLLLTTPVNIELRSDWDNIKEEAIISLKIAYNRDMSDDNHRFAIALCEDNIRGKQAGADENYIHNRVLRTTLTRASGDSLNAQLVPGRVFEKQYRYKPKLNYDPINLNIIAYIYSNNDRRILNVREQKMIL